jgi:SagB-type dehydrogenase family enzyme
MKKLVIVSAVVSAAVLHAGDIHLPAPDVSGGRPLMQTLSLRKSSRAFSPRMLSHKTLSSRLWAANGVSRPDGRRTAPTGRNVQDTDVYVMLADGMYLYDAKANALRLVASGDRRDLAGLQDFARTAPVNLFYVHDSSRAMKTAENEVMRYAGIHAGAIMQNVYLFCASEGLACVTRAMLDYDGLAKALKLSPTQRVIIGHSVGYIPDDGYIGREAAVRAALQHAGIDRAAARDLDCELDRENGRMVYEVDFEAGGMEYDYDIDAKSGAVLKSKKERDR